MTNADRRRSCSHPCRSCTWRPTSPKPRGATSREMVGHIKDEFEQPPAQQPLAGRAHPRGGAGQAGQGGHPGRLPAAVDRLQRRRHPPRRPLRQRPARRRVPAAARTRPGSASRWWSSALPRPPNTTPISVNAAYNPQTNSIDITAAIVQPPFYMPGADAAVNYCTIGAVIGHELTHGFDSNGRQYGPGRQPARLVDAAGHGRVQEAHRRAGAAVQRVHAAARPEAQRRTDADREHRRPGRHHAGACGAAPRPGRQAAAQDRRPDDRPALLRGLGADVGLQGPARSGCACWPPSTTTPTAPLRGYAPLLHLDAFHKAFGTRPGDPMWRAPKDRVVIW